MIRPTEWKEEAARTTRLRPSRAGFLCASTFTLPIATRNWACGRWAWGTTRFLLSNLAGATQACDSAMKASTNDIKETTEREKVSTGGKLMTMLYVLRAFYTKMFKC